MNKRVLIIDDEPDIILTLRMALEQNGFRTDSYSDSILAYKNFELAYMIRAAGYKDAKCGWISVISENKKDRQ